MEAVSRKGGRKRAGKGASGSSSRREKKEAGKAKRKTRSKVEVGFDLGKQRKEVASEGAVLLPSMFGDEIKDIFGLSDDDDEWAEWKACLANPPTISEAEAAEARAAADEKLEASIAELEKRMADQMKPFGEDYNAYRASRFRSDWECIFSRLYGAYEDTTRIPAMRFTSKPPPGGVTPTAQGATPTPTLQVFSVRVEVEPTRLPFPLHVFGLVALRDSIDNNRNLVFQRARDNCQILTKEHPYLLLTGPSRAVFLESTTPVFIEVDLSVKGGDDHSEDDDEKLSFLVDPLVPHDTSYTRLWNRHHTSKLSTVHMTLGCIPCSVEATIFVQVTSGSWPVGFQAQLSAFATRSPYELSDPFTEARVDDEEIVLLDSGGDESVPLSADGSIQLSRRVVSVQNGGELKVCVKAWSGSDNITEKWAVFNPLLAGTSNSSIDIEGLCAMNVTVAWSLVSYRNVFAESTL